jgi:hypothetical protein
VIRADRLKSLPGTAPRPVCCGLVEETGRAPCGCVAGWVLRHEVWLWAGEVWLVPAWVAAVCHGRRCT